jgi:hypothetical protein
MVNSELSLLERSSAEFREYIAPICSLPLTEADASSSVGAGSFGFDLPKIRCMLWLSRAHSSGELDTQRREAKQNSGLS